MKYLTVSLLLVIVSAACVMSVAGQGSGCSSGKRADGIYYTDCYPFNAMTDGGDDERLQRAVDGATGKLIFNEDIYYVDEPVNLHSYLTIEGLSPIKYGSGGSSPRVVLIADNQNIFQIGPGVVELAIRDLGFYYYTDPIEAPTNANAIQAEAANSSSGTSVMIEFSNLRFSNFTKGIYVNNSSTPPGWQFDNLHVSDSIFDACKYGIYLNSDNAGAQLDNLMFSSGEDQNAIWIERSGYVTMNMIVGNGNRDGKGLPISGEFIHLDRHSPININSAFGEAYTKSLTILGYTEYKFAPVVITNSFLPACVDADTSDDSAPAITINNASVVSEGNFYGCGGLARPIVEGTSDIYSTGDKFCSDAALAADSDCFEHASGKRSEFVLKSNKAVLRIDNNAANGDLYLATLDITNTNDLAAKPLLSLTSSIFGYPSASDVTKVRYAFTRNGTTGRLEVAGDQAVPNTGYVFKNGPVQLHSVTQSSLSSYNVTSDNGSMLFCSDCTAPSTPCSGSGSGALALRVGSAWNCK